MNTALYRKRRLALMAAMGPRAVAIFHAAPETIRNGDAHYRYRPSSDILYLTGFEEPECALVLRPGASEEREILFVRRKDPEREVWDGMRFGPDGACRE